MARLTAKQRGLVSGIVDGKSNRQAALDAGYGGGTNADAASVQATRTLKSAKVASALDAALDKAGATLDKSARVIAEAHDATRSTGAGSIPDHKTRLAAAEMNGKFRKLIGGTADEGGMVMGIGFFLVKGMKDRGMGA